MTLLKIFLARNGTKLNYTPTNEDMKTLSDLDYISFTENTEDKNSYSFVRLTSKGMDIFLSNKDMFHKLIEIYPTSVKTNRGGRRALSVKDPNGIIASKLRKKWLAITKGDLEYQTKVLKCLKKEIEIRKRSGELAYMQNVETWLHNATWEKYEHLIDKDEDSTTHETSL